jgi:hypothetical protein
MMRASSADVVRDLMVLFTFLWFTVQRAGLADALKDECPHAVFFCFASLPRIDSVRQA